MESREASTGFQQYWLMLKRRWLPASIAFSAIFALTAAGLLMRKPTYVAEGKLQFRRTSPTSSLTGLGTEIGQLDPLQYQNSPLDTEAEVMRSAPITTNTINKLNLTDQEGSLLSPHQFLGQLSVRNIPGTDVLQVTYKDRNPERAAAVVNTLMTSYLENNIVNNRSAAAAARKFIEEQLPQAKATLQERESALRAFREQNSIVSLTEEKRTAVDTAADIQRQINTIQTQLADAQAQSALLQKQLGRGLQQASTATTASQLPVVQELLAEIQRVESQLAIDRGRFQADHPTIAASETRKAELERLLQQRVQGNFGSNQPQNLRGLQLSPYEQNLTQDLARSEARRLGLDSQLTALSNLQTAYTQKLNGIPKLEQQQGDLERERDTTQSTYSLLQQRYQEARIAENQNASNASIISAAFVPPEPVGSRQLLILAALLMGGLAAAATIYILEARDKSLKTVDEAKRVFGLPLLGIIPALKKSEKTVVRHGELERATPEVVVWNAPRSPFSAVYRMLQANLKFLSSDKELKIIVVSSAVPKEGKSTVAANLAATMAQSGRRVLLVDADMHHPVQHHIWETTNQTGLSNLLVGQAEFQTAIQFAMPNLDVLPAGVTPPNPVALLDSQKMAALMTRFTENYDFTIIDTPAINVDAEAPILGKMADGVVLVVRPGVSDANNAALAKQFLQQSNQNILGLVINGVVPENEPQSYYYFSQEYNTADANLVPKAVQPKIRK
ncbi:GumC family protein [Gloeocapsopsis dulcis]|nr:polysaccharide biosynthesis tyrosine autokinase [Gloeocapsopsis dulcis]WNN90814.1 polysaccharide biosynthesis tyrosine autokinase [Gloeocapsopsis dulcis]